MVGHAELLALLLPPVSYAPTGAALQAELFTEGKALDATLTSADRFQGAITPFFAEQLLPDWERVCGITPSADAAYQQRLQAVLAKLAETGGLSIPYFTRLAASLGYTITIVEPQPFRAGINRAGDPLWVEDIQWVWQVVVASQSRSYLFRAGQSVAGERLTSFGDPVIESVISDLKPAHTFVYFAYQG
ncbi:phage tail protein [Crenobacter luteus]|uniref:Phage tail protein n=1 Tax=Crenobacter luteus TaxID=1452487 RepID=A0A163DA42_9NEIS|nr:phage tail protein [Crenobacter luteus]